MLDPNIISSMRNELTKLATAGVGQPPVHQYEEMNKKKWIQTAKDFPVVIAGGALGYGLGHTGAQYLVPKMFKSPEAQQKLMRGLPWAAAAASGLGSYLAMVQQRMLQERREQAAKEPGGTVQAENEQPPQTTVNGPVPKTGGAIVPNVGARRTDPWRQDRRYPEFKG